MVPTSSAGGVALSHDALRTRPSDAGGRTANAVALEFFARFVDLASPDTSVHTTSDPAAVAKLPRQDYKAVANTARLNDLRRINKFLEVVNAKLATGGRFLGCVETAALRNQRHRATSPPLLAHLYLCADFVFARVFPKLPGLKQLYFAITRGRNRVLTLTEALGRLYCCGFRLEHMEEQGHLLFFSVIKESEPSFDTNPSYGPLFGMRRVGRGGKEIVVWKIRTMHAYAEYLQHYVYEVNRLETGGKFKNDFRVSPVGRLLRTVWVDELPMIWNLLRGDMKPVGVRPLSRHYLSLLPEEARDRRKQYTPGLMPPYYADLPKTLDEFVACELRYFDAYDRQPFLTDARYLLRALFNIVFRGARSG